MSTNQGPIVETDKVGRGVENRARREVGARRDTTMARQMDNDRSQWRETWCAHTVLS